MMQVVEKIKAKQADLNASPAVTIAFLGDSVTQGCFEVYKTGPDTLQTVFDPTNSYPVRLREKLALLYPQVQINIINSGISGDNAPGGLERLERDILRYHPDLVIVSYGLNDSINGFDGIPAYNAALEGIFRGIRQSGAECIFMTENMMNTHTSCHLQNQMLIRLSQEFAEIENGGILEAYFDAAKICASQHGIQVCDCYSKWKYLAKAGVDTTELLANKLNHPCREIIDLFAVSLLEIILGL